MNNTFITLNLAIIAAVSFAWDSKSFLLLAAGIVVCVLWLLFIRNFKLLNTAKFSVINAMERKLPASPFNDEWATLQKETKYYDGTKLERVLPLTFIILYCLAGVVIFLKR